MQKALMFDSEKCSFCKRCITACDVENGLNGQWRRNVMILKETNTSEHGGKSPWHQSCHHCENPACVSACPRAGLAIAKRKDDGIVIVNHEHCTGCGLCVTACPFGLIKLSAHRNSKGQFVADNCTLCLHRHGKKDNGQLDNLPACVVSCPRGALEFGKRTELLARMSRRGREGLPIEHQELRPSTVYVSIRSVTKIIVTS